MDGVLNRIIDVLKTENPERIYLFGSRASGNERSGSDYDICMIKKFDEDIWTEESRRIYRKLRLAVPEVATDFILYTPESFEEDKDVRAYVTYDIFRKGKVIYENRSGKGLIS